MRIKRPFPSSAKTLSVGNKLIGTLFFSVFAGMGLLFVVLISREVAGRYATRSWPATPCVIVQSEANARGVEGNRKNLSYTLNLLYRYSIGGNDYTSERYRKDFNGASTYEEVDQIAKRFPVGSNQTCYVDPTNPKLAVLEHGSLAFGFMILLPLVFVAIGATGVWSMWRSPAPGVPTSSLPATPAMQRNVSKFGLPLFLGFFTLFGGAMLGVMFVPPLLKVLAARTWTPTPATILSSRLVTHSSSDGSTYSIDIFYSYVFNDRLYKSSRYKFMGGSSSGYQGKAAVVQSLPPGKEVTCYVDPANPAQAVIERGFTADMWFAAIPGVFCIIGLGGLFYTFFAKPARDRKQAAADFPAMIRAEKQAAGISVPGPSGLIELPPTLGPVGKVIVGLIFAAFWNGIVSIFVWKMLEGWQRGSPDYCLTAFLIPFMLIGVGSFGFVLHALLALRNPRVILRISANPVFPGETVTLEWELTGAYDSVERVTVTLQGELRRREGKKTNLTDLHKSVVVDETRRMNAFKRKQIFVIPEDARPSDETFGSDNDTVTWKLTARAYIPNWPDTTSDHILRIVAPQITNSASPEASDG